MEGPDGMGYRRVSYAEQCWYIVKYRLYLLFRRDRRKAKWEKESATVSYTNRRSRRQL